MEDKSYTNLPTSYLLGSVPAVVKEEGKNANDYVDMSGGGNRGRGYQSPSNSSDFEMQMDHRNAFAVLSLSIVVCFILVVFCWRWTTINKQLAGTA